MSSILNSISSGDLLVQHVPRENPVKEDSIIDLLKNSEIEFETCQKPSNNLENINSGFNELNELYFDEKLKTSEVIIPEKITTTLEVEQCPVLDESVNNFNSGFGKDNDLHIEHKNPSLNTPLYKENYLLEFQTQEEKAAARHALGLYNKEDVVEMSLLTAEDEKPSDLKNVPAKQLRKGDKFFTPYTTTQSVLDSDGVSLSKHLTDITNNIVANQKEIIKINNVSTGNTIVSLGDMKTFLAGFTKEDNLYDTIDQLNKDTLRFEKTGIL